MTVCIWTYRGTVSPNNYITKLLYVSFIYHGENQKRKRTSKTEVEIYIKIMKS